MMSNLIMSFRSSGNKIGYKSDVWTNDMLVYLIICHKYEKSAYNRYLKKKRHNVIMIYIYITVIYHPEIYDFPKIIIFTINYYRR